MVPKVEVVTGNHHKRSHHGQDPANIGQLQKIEREIVECFGRLLTQMKSRSESGSTLLENTSILFESNLGNANTHHGRNLPIFLAGARFRHGLYVAHEEGTSLCNLFVTMLNDMRLDTESFGQSTSELRW